MRKQIILCWLLLGPMGCMAQKTISLAEQSAIIKQAEVSAASITTLQCTFVQEKQMTLLNSKMVSTGSLAYKKPGKLRWAYASPTPFVFLLDGTMVVMKSEHKKSTIDIKSSALFQEIVRIMMSSVTGKCLSDNKNFKVSIRKDNAGYIAHLIPTNKKMGQMFHSIQLSINPNTGIVSKVVLTEKSGDATTIYLKNIKKNIALDENLFVVD